MKKTRYEPPTRAQFEQLIKTKAPKSDGHLAEQSLIQTCGLRNGPQAYRGACLLQIADHESGEIVKKRLTLSSWRFRVGSGIDWEKPTYRWFCEDGEIEALRIFLDQYLNATEEGHHAVVRVDPAARNALRRMIDALNTPGFGVDQLGGLVTALAGRADDLRQIRRTGEHDDRRLVAAALRAAHRAEAVSELQQLIRVTEREIVDLLLQTADNYFEIVELKRAHVPLTTMDHGVLIPTVSVHKAVNQAANYIGEIEARRDYFARRHGIDLFKLRAKVVIGYIDDAEENANAQREALRRYNAHLHGVEVVTYDELERIAQHVVRADEVESEMTTPVDSHSGRKTRTP